MSKGWIVTGEEVFDAGDNPLDNAFYGYRKTHLLLPDGKGATYHGIIVPDIVHVVAVEEDLTTYLVRQKRPNIRTVGQAGVPETLELPGGFVSPHLGQVDSAQKELIEEVGVQANALQHIGTLLPSVGVSNEKDFVYLGTSLEPAADTASRDVTEQDIEIVAAPFGRMYDQIINSEVPVSAQTLAALSMAAARL
jgi:8-oxo-dGTP pyrophosphatase MutT (NUDIX family)